MNPAQLLTSTTGNSLRKAFAVLALGCAFALVASRPADAQQLNTLFNFSLQTGYAPYGGVTRDVEGNLYGTTSGNGIDAGTVYELKRSNGSWITKLLFTFSAENGSNPAIGYWPWSGVVFGPDGALYGTTYGGGIGGLNGYGLVYRLAPPATFCRQVQCLWTETVLHDFAGGSDGATPGFGNLTFDAAGNIYGTTTAGGAANAGTVYELTPSNGGWTEKVLYSFRGGSDGANPYGRVVFDQSGNLYGTTVAGGGAGCSNGKGCGTIFELTPSGSGWTETLLYAFQNSADGATPYGGLTIDPSGNLYGSTLAGGSQNGGTVFELALSNGGWNFSLLYALPAGAFGPGGPTNNLAMDAAGVLYGATSGDGDRGVGTVFKLSPQNGGWTYTLLHTFDNGPNGGEPYGAPIVDAMGVVYGTASTGGTQNCSFEINCGTVWEITP